MYKNLLKEMKKWNVTVDEIAKAIGVKSTLLSKKLSGEKELLGREAAAIACYLKGRIITMDYLFAV